MQISPIRLTAFAFFFLALGVARPQEYTLTIPIRAVAQDSSKPVPLTWAATETGIFRSSETGLDWKNVFVRPAGQAQPAVRSIHIDPTNPKIVYLITNLDAGGVWKTVDGGTEWKQMNKGLPTQGGLDGFIPLPTAPLTFYARVGNRIFKTVDGGANWTQLGTLPVTGVGTFEVDRRNPTSMFATLNNAVYRSSNEGASWRLSQVLNAGTITSMLVDPTDSNIVHMAIAGPKSDRPGFYRSSDGGEVFARADRFDVDRLVPNRLISDPTGRSVYAGYDEDGFIFRSDDKGITWIALAVATGSGFTTLAIDPGDPRILIAGTAKGVFKSDNSGFVWRDVRGPAKPTISLPPVPLEFVLPANSQGQMQMVLRVVETSLWTLPVSASIQSGSWLKLDGSTVNTPARPFVSVDTRGLELGEYTGAVRVESGPSSNAPVTVPVKLTVVPPSAASRSYKIATFAGNGQRGNFGDNQAATRAFFGDLDSVATDHKGNVYVTDPASNVVRRIDPDGVITRFAGNARRGDSGDGGSALLAQLDTPSGIAVDADDNIYIADTGNAKIKRVTKDGNIKTMVSNIGPCRGIAVDSGGNMYITVPAAHVVLRINPDGRGGIYAGAVGLSGFQGDGGAPGGALLNGPLDIFIDARDRVYIADTGNHRVRRVASGVITTIAGNGVMGFQGDGADATKLALSSPGGVAADSAGNVYVADSENNRIRVVRTDGSIRTLGGTGVRGYTGDNGPAVLAQVAGPVDIGFDGTGAVLSVESGNLRVRRLEAPAAAVAPVVSLGPVNYADGSTRLAPGTVFLLRGTDLAAETAVRSDAPWALFLGGTQVTLNGQPVPLTAVSPTQIVGLIPYDAGLGDGTLVVVREETPSAEVAVNIVPAAPAIFQTDPGHALAVNENGTVNWKGDPATPDTLVTVYFTGSGLPENPPTGAAGAGEESKLLLPVTVQFGVYTLDDVRARLTPGRVGIAEVRFRVPAVDPGEHPVSVRVGDILSAPASVTVGPAQ